MRMTAAEKRQLGQELGMTEAQIEQIIRGEAENDAKIDQLIEDQLKDCTTDEERIQVLRDGLHFWCSLSTQMLPLLPTEVRLAMRSAAFNNLPPEKQVKFMRNLFTS